MPAALPVADGHFSLTQAALKIGRTRQFVLSLAAAGALRSIPMSGRLFFEVAEVEQLVRRLAAGEPSRATARRARA
jgi:hypothetical protein